MKELKERECDACSHFLLAGRVQASTKQLYISGNFAVTCTIAECDLVYTSGMYDSKSFVTGRRRRASHTSMIEVNNEASLFESCLPEKGALPLLCRYEKPSLIFGHYISITHLYVMERIEFVAPYQADIACQIG